MKRFLVFALIFVYSCSNGLKEIKTFYPSGEIKTKYYIDDKGQRQGKAYKYYKNGKIEEMHNYVDNKLHGKVLTYFTNGKVFTNSQYENGIIINDGKKYWENGVLGVRQYFNKKGKKEKVIFYDEDKKLVEIDAYNMMSNKLHSYKVINKKGTIDTIESNFIKLKRKNNKLYFKIYSDRIKLFDSLKIYILKSFKGETYKFSSKNIREITLKNSVEDEFSIKESDFINNRINIYLEAHQYFQCEDNKYQLCSYSRDFYIQFNKDDYDIKDNLNPIYP